VGDGTGVGKGREIASLVLDNLQQGRRRAVWCSISTVLLYDAQRDLVDLGRSDVKLYPLHKMPYGELPHEVEDGVMFCTYQSLIAQNKQNERRIDQIIAWAAQSSRGDPEAFDGCLVFDEAHRAKNLASSGGKGTKTGDMVLHIQKALPNARVMYVSATAAADVSDLGYMVRLGLWGKGTAFEDFKAFEEEINKAGVGMMEVLAMDMKSRGMFVSRQLSFHGCSFEMKRCQLTDEDQQLYDDAVAFWDALLCSLESSAEATGREPGSVTRHYWGQHQSFFKQLLNSLKARFAIAESLKALEQGKCVVIGLVSTGEAKANEAADRALVAGRELEGEVSTPHEIARDVLEKHMPTTFADGAESQPAMELKQSLVAQLERIKMPGNALDMLVAQFGVSKIAEMTGRKWRFVTHADGTTRREPRAENGMSQDQVNLAEKAAFLNGKKPVAVISDAASSGISLHADPRFKNTKKRLHITLELAWSADKMLQQFGRTHRSNQLCAPHYQILTTDVGGEQRFASSVARRLETLGAITRGDRRGGHGMAADLVQFNLDTDLGRAALSLMLDAVAEKTERAMLWDRALRMLQCHRQGVPTLLGLCVVGVAQCPATALQKQKEVQRLPAGLQKYVLKLREWTSERLQTGRQRPPEQKTYGDCPKSPVLHLRGSGEAFGWQVACDCLKRMRILNSKLTPNKDADRNDINKFLNRLLGLPFAQQNALFDYYTQVPTRSLTVALTPNPHTPTPYPLRRLHTGVQVGGDDGAAAGARGRGHRARRRREHRDDLRAGGHPQGALLPRPHAPLHPAGRHGALPRLCA